jgi:hypothetical protein
LADLNSIIRKGNNVVFPDTTNFSICLYNVNNKNYSYKDFYTSANIYLISKFIKNGLDIFETIATFPPPSSTPIDMANVDRIKCFNNIIRNISYDKIILLKENVINKDKIYEEVKNEIRLNFIKLITDKTRLIQLLENCEKNIREKNSREADEVKILLDKIKVSTQTDIFELAKEIGLDYKICNYNHMKKNEEIQNELERIRISKNLNLKDINYYRFLSFYNNIIQSLALFNDITKFNSRTFQQELNNNIKFIMTGYLKHIENNIRENLEKTDVIQYFAEKIIFDKVNFNPTIKNIYYEITKKILKNISISNKSIIKKIIKIINETDKDLLDPEILKKMLSNIHNYLKIIDIFVFYTSGIQDENPTNIHECIVELRKYIFDLLAYKKNITSQDKKKINFFTITRDPKILFTNIIEANISKEYKLRGVGIKSFHLIKNFFKNIDNMNYVIFFNNFYNHFEKLKDLKILDIPLENDKNHLKMIIKQIKDIYTYTYINIYNTAYNVDYFTNFFSGITTIIDDKTKEIIKKLRTNPANQDKITYFEAVIERLKVAINTSKANLEFLDTNIKERRGTFDYSSIGYFLKLDDNEREVIEYDYKITIVLSNPVLINKMIELIKLGNKIELTDFSGGTIPPDLLKMINIFNYFFY